MSREPWWGPNTSRSGPALCFTWCNWISPTHKLVCPWWCVHASRIWSCTQLGQLHLKSALSQSWEVDWGIYNSSPLCALSIFACFYMQKKSWADFKNQPSNKLQFRGLISCNLSYAQLYLSNVSQIYFFLLCFCL